MLTVLLSATAYGARAVPEQHNHDPVENLRSRVCTLMFIVLTPSPWIAIIPVFTSITRPASPEDRNTGNTVSATVPSQLASRRHTFSASVTLCYWRRCSCLGASRRLKPIAHKPHALSVIAKEDSTHEQHDSQVRARRISFARRMPHHNMSDKSRWNISTTSLDPFEACHLLSA